MFYVFSCVFMFSCVMSIISGGVLLTFGVYDPVMIFSTQLCSLHDSRRFDSLALVDVDS